MADLHPYDIIIRPVITEKSNVMASDENQYVFEVARNANKIQIKEAVEFIYNMEGEVLLVRTMVMPAQTGQAWSQVLHPAAPVEEGRRHPDARQQDRTVQRLGRDTMPIKVYKPTSAGRRDMTGYTFEEITKSRPERSLTEAMRKRGGRNNKGRVTVHHRGGGHKRRYRIIDFKRNKSDSRAEVIAVEYDPEPFRPYCPGAVRGWRASLHHRPARPQGRRQRWQWRPGRAAPR